MNYNTFFNIKPKQVKKELKKLLRETRLKNQEVQVSKGDYKKVINRRGEQNYK